MNYHKIILDALEVGLDADGTTEVQEYDIQKPVLLPMPPTETNTVVRINGQEFMLTIRPHEVGEYESEPLELTADMEAPAVRTFKNDHRHKPGLHKLYVDWALEDLRICRDAMLELMGQSRWPANDIATAMWDRVRQTIREDAAWFEAAALLFAQELQDRNGPPKIFAGESLRHLPPGEFTGFITTDKSGRLVFEVQQDGQAEEKG